MSVDELGVPVVKQPAALNGGHSGDAVFQQAGHGQMNGLHAELVRQVAQHIGAQHIVGIVAEHAGRQRVAVQLHAVQRKRHFVIEQRMGVEHTDVIFF